MTACCEDIDFPEHSSDPEEPRQAGITDMEEASLFDKPTIAYGSFLLVK